MSQNTSLDLLFLINETSVDALRQIRRRSSSEELEDRRADICLNRLGMSGDGDHVTLRELGNFYGISRERIRQIESKHIARLASKLCRRHDIWERLKDLMDSQNSDIDEISYELISEVNNRSNVEFLIALLIFFKEDRKKWRVSRQKARQTVSAAITRRSEWLQVQLRENKQALKVDSAVNRVRNSLLLRVDLRESPKLEFSKLASVRNISEDGAGVSGNFFSEKNGKNINYESYGEFFLYQLLEKSSLILSYLEQPLIIHYTFGRISANYYPDVLIRYEDGSLICVETKDSRRVADAITLAKAQAATQFLAKKNIGYCLVDSRLTSLQDIINEGPSVLDEELLPIIKSFGFVDWFAVRDAIINRQLGRHVITSFILRNQLFHSKSPFRIRECTPQEKSQIFGLRAPLLMV